MKDRGCTGTLPITASCLNCNNQGFKSQTKREGGVTYVEYTLCRCERGRELEKLWEKYPAWLGAPYDFFYRR